MSPSSILATIAFLLLAPTSYASPTPSTPSNKVATSIPLTRNIHPSKRFTTDAEKAAWLTDIAAGLRTKYGADDAPATRARRGFGENQLVNSGTDTSYFGSIAVGTPAMSFNVILDTGSADLWIADSNCYTGCGSVPAFDASSSTTFRNLSTSFAIKYGSGAAQGSLGSDSVQMAGFGVAGQTFAVCNAVTRGLLTNPISGLMGLAFSTLATSGATPFWQTLASTNAWDEPLMAFHLTRFKDVSGAQKLEVGGSFDLGFTNTSLYTGDIDYVDIPDGKTSFWLIPLTEIDVNGNTLTAQGEVLAAIDTGTTLIGGPSDSIASIFAQIPGAQPAGADYQGYYAFPCDTNVQVSLKFGDGQAWSIDPTDFVLTEISGGYCIGAFFELNLSGTSSPSWIIGDTFLKNVYSVFRYNPPSVGFANLSTVATAQSSVVDAPLPSASVGTSTVSSGALPSLSSPFSAVGVLLCTVVSAVLFVLV